MFADISNYPLPTVHCF